MSMSAFFPMLAEVDTNTLIIIIGVSVSVLIVMYFGVRFWMVSTREPAIPEVISPVMEKASQEALQHMTEVTLEEDEQETEAMKDADAPAELRQAAEPAKAQA